jgi:hypothetical protein
VPATTPAQEAPSAPAGKKVLTYGIAKEYNVGGKRLDDRTIDELQVMAEDKNKAPSTQTAIRVVLDYKVSQAMNAEKKE